MARFSWRKWLGFESDLAWRDRLRAPARPRLERLEDRLTPANIVPLASFLNTTGATPSGVLVEDSSGNLFGTAQAGGTGGGYGTVFEVAHGSGAVTTLASFNASNGVRSSGGLVEDSSGDLFGTTGGEAHPGSARCLN
jgi:hypothetical protein